VLQLPFDFGSDVTHRSQNQMVVEQPSEPAEPAGPQEWECTDIPEECIPRPLIHVRLLSFAANFASIMFLSTYLCLDLDFVTYCLP
jgi:hypothetical protein